MRPARPATRHSPRRRLRQSIPRCSSSSPKTTSTPSAATATAKSDDADLATGTRRSRWLRSRHHRRTDRNARSAQRRAEDHGRYLGIVTIQDGPSLLRAKSSLPPRHWPQRSAQPQQLSGSRRIPPRRRPARPAAHGLTDGTYFINRWFASVEINIKTVVPIGYVGVVVSYYGHQGKDVSGDAFRHGERVGEGERGVWEKPLGPGKYPFNRYAATSSCADHQLCLALVTGKSESHRYDESLRSIDLVTRDAYEPLLPLSVVVHIDYQRARRA